MRTRRRHGPARSSATSSAPGRRVSNSARNTGIAAAGSDLVVFVDDDVDAPPGWLGELVAGRERHPGALAFGGPIRLRLEESRLPMCGREPPPLTNLDGGDADREIELVWGANMALDKRALELAGTFDEGVPYGFDEDMWERRLRAAGGRIVYLARAGLVHRRDARDARLTALVREAYRRGRALRRYVAHRGDAPSLLRELRVLAGCVFHVFRYRCGNGILLTAHSVAAASPVSGAKLMGQPAFDPELVLSGQSGIVTGRRARLRAMLRDLGDEAASWLRLVPPRLARAARSGEGSVCVVGTYAADHGRSIERAVAELRRSGRPVSITLAALDQPAAGLEAETRLEGLRGQGKFENLNALLEIAPPGDAPLGDRDRRRRRAAPWLPRPVPARLRAPRLDLAQPALTHSSHSAWPVFRRRRWTRRAHDAHGRDRAADGLLADGGGRASAVPGAQDGVGPRFALGRARARARLAARGRRRHADPAFESRHRGQPTTVTRRSRSCAGSSPHRPWIDRETANSVIETHANW